MALSAGKIFALVILIVTALALPSMAQTKHLLGYSSLSSNQTPIWVAKEEGF